MSSSGFQERAFRKRLLFQLLVGKGFPDAIDGFINGLKVEMSAGDIAHAEEMAKEEIKARSQRRD
ncbi:MAG: hypothetical protein LBE35_08380 [Clostridiales bacterium]|jgi:hypothetical protein|nr:hypothetical protein [Clostridiales bacterium]